MPSLPEEIIVLILSFLPVKSISRFRCVSKNWCNKLIKDPKFVKLHLNHAIVNNKYFSLLTRQHLPMYSVNLCLSSSLSAAQNNESVVVEIDSPFRLLDSFYKTYGSCDGLILMSNPWNYPGLILWNPSTKEVKEIPEPVEPEAADKRIWESNFVPYTQCGIGYSPITDDYKIVRAEMSAFSGTYRSVVKVYTLGSNSWERIPDVVPRELYSGGGNAKPVCVNGALHWVGSSIRSSRIVIFSFDMENNTFNEVPVIPELQESPGYDVRCINDLSSLNLLSFRSADSGEYTFLSIFGGCLSVVLQCGELDSARNNNSDISIWVMKEYGVKESWSKMFNITKQALERSIQYSEMKVLNAMHGVVLFLKDKTSLVIYDPKHETTRVVNICGLNVDWSYVQTFVESLTSLGSGTYLHLRCPQRKPSQW